MILLSVMVRFLGWLVVVIAFEYGYSCSERYVNLKIPKGKLCGIYWLFVFVVRFLSSDVTLLFHDLVLACCALASYYYLNQHYDLLSQLQRLPEILSAAIGKIRARINGK